MFVVVPAVKFPKLMQVQTWNPLFWLISVENSTNTVFYTSIIIPTCHIKLNSPWYKPISLSLMQSIETSKIKENLDLFPICNCGNQVNFFFCNEFSVNPSQPNYSSIFSILFSVHFLWRWQGEFVEQSKLLWLVIFPFILMILINDSAVLL